MTTERKNFANKIPCPVDDTEYVRCNFSQSTTPLPDGVGGKKGIDVFPQDDDTTVRTFRNCNMVNVKIRPGYVVESCNTALIEFDRVDVVDQDTVELPGGEEMGTEVPHDLVHGRYLQGGTVEYKPSPERIIRRRRRR